MSQITVTFSEPMAVPPDGSGVTFTDDSGNSLTIVTVGAGASSDILLYNGPWAPLDPVPGVDTVTVNYTQSVGDLQSLVGTAVGSFSALVPACGNATDLNATANGSAEINLTWVESLDDPTVTYELFRNGISIQTFVYGENSYSDSGLDPDTYYEYVLHTLYSGNSIGSITDWTRTAALVALPVSSGLSLAGFHSFDLQVTLDAPLNRASVEFNSARFSF